MIGQLTARIVMDVGTFNQDVEQSRTSLGTVGKTAVKSQSEVKGLGTQFSKAATSVSTLADETARLGTVTKDLASTAGSLRQVTSETSRLEKLETGLANTKQQVEAVSDAATDAQFNFLGVSRSLTAVSTAAKPIGWLNNNVGVLANTTSLAASGTAQVAAAFGMASTGATYLASGVGVLLYPLRGLVVVPKLIAGAFGVMFAAVTAPLKLAIGAVTLFAKGVWAAVQPVVALAGAIFKFKVSLASIQMQIALLGKFMSMLPPKIRAVVAGLIALGAAGKAGRVAINLAGKAFHMLRIASLSVTQPLRAAKLLALDAGKAFGIMAIAAGRASVGLTKMALASTTKALKGLGGAVVSVTKSIAGGLVGAVATAAKWIAAIGGAGLAWGFKLASDAEQATIGFTTMLKSAKAARAVLTELETFSASTPFALADLQEGARQLLTAQIGTGELTTKLKMLGDVAAGTQKPINDYVGIYSKVANTGKAGLDVLNQFAERGVPIFSALQTELGVSRTELLKLVSSGKIGFAEVDGALQSITTGTGMFAGAVNAQASSLSGRLSTLKDNVGFVAMDIGAMFIEAFNVKGAIASLTTGFQTIREGFQSLKPAVMAWAGVVKAQFAAVAEIASVVFGGIASASSITTGGLMEGFIKFATTAKWAFQNWPDIAELAFVQMQVSALAGFGTITHFFGVQLPVLFDWFSKNWKNIFFTAGDLVGSVFLNIGKNIRTAMEAIWAYIASGGTESLELAWTPLLDGFKNTISEIPDLPPRVVSGLEKQLKERASNLANKVGAGLGEELSAAMADLQKFRANAGKGFEMPDVGPPRRDPPEVVTVKQNRDPQFAGAMTRSSAEAFKTVVMAQRRHQVKTAGDIAIEKAVTKQTTELVKVMKNPPPGPQFAMQGPI